MTSPGDTVDCHALCQVLDVVLASPHRDSHACQGNMRSPQLHCCLDQCRLENIGRDASSPASKGEQRFMAFDSSLEIVKSLHESFLRQL